MADSVFSEPERCFFAALRDLGVRFMLVDMSAALVQGARGATDDLDLWFERLDDPRLAEAARRAGGFWMSGSFGMRPPGVGGPGLGDRIDVVTHLDGLRDFDREYADARAVEIDGLELHVLPLERIVASKEATGRPKDLAQLPALREALAVRDDGEDDDAP